MVGRTFRMCCLNVFIIEILPHAMYHYKFAYTWGFPFRYENGVLTSTARGREGGLLKVGAFIKIQEKN